MPSVVAAAGNFTLVQAGVLMSLSAAGDASNGDLVISLGASSSPTNTGRTDVLLFVQGPSTGLLKDTVDFSAVGGIPLQKKQQVISVNGGSILMVFK